MKMLYILNVTNKVNSFCMSSLAAAKELGIEFHIAGNWGYKNDAERKADENKYGIHIYQVDFMRSPLNPKNRKAYEQLKKIVKRESFDLIHSNTPIGGILGRLAGKKYKVKNNIYQVHGFHFYKGAPKLNWLIYYPIEKWFAHYTDALVTINTEDYAFAQKKIRLRKKGGIYYVSGVGIDLEEYMLVNTDRTEKRTSLGLSEDDVVLIAAGRLDANKNNETIIRAVARVQGVKLLMCGDGEQKQELIKLSRQLGVGDRVLFLGNRTDIKELYKASDIFTMMSFREGLSRSIMEAMASELPCVVSEIRGNVDLIDNGKGGYLVPVCDDEAMADRIRELAENVSLRNTMSEYNKERVKDYDLSVAVNNMKKIYVEVLGI